MPNVTIKLTFKVSDSVGPDALDVVAQGLARTVDSAVADAVRFRGGVIYGGVRGEVGFHVRMEPDVGGSAGSQPDLEDPCGNCGHPWNAHHFDNARLAAEGIYCSRFSNGGDPCSRRCPGWVVESAGEAVRGQGTRGTGFGPGWDDQLQGEGEGSEG